MREKHLGQISDHIIRKPYNKRIPLIEVLWAVYDSLEGSD